MIEYYVGETVPDGAEQIRKHLGYVFYAIGVVMLLVKQGDEGKTVVNQYVSKERSLVEARS